MYYIFQCVYYVWRCSKCARRGLLNILGSCISCILNSCTCSRGHIADNYHVIYTIQELYLYNSVAFTIIEIILSFCPLSSMFLYAREVEKTVKTVKTVKIGDLFSEYQGDTQDFQHEWLNYQIIMALSHALLLGYASICHPTP